MLLGVVLAGLACMVSSMGSVAMSYLRMMGGLLVIARFVVLGGLAMMLCRALVVLRSL